MCKFNIEDPTLKTYENLILKIYRSLGVPEAEWQVGCTTDVTPRFLLVANVFPIKFLK